jgi:hypothetical protein
MAIIICRCCLTKSAEISYFNMLEHNLKTIYEEITAIQVLTTETVTTKLCGLCKQQLEAFQSFRNQCLDSYLRLKFIEDDTELIDIPQLSKKVEHTSSEQLPTRKTKRGKANPLKDDSSREILVGQDGIKKYCCRFCKRKTFVRLKAVEKHEESHSQKKSIICDMCGAVLINQQSLRSHKRYKHSDDRPFACNQCTLCFKSKAELTEHVAVCHVCERKFICDICSQASKSLVRFVMIDKIKLKY